MSNNNFKNAENLANSNSVETCWLISLFFDITNSTEMNEEHDKTKLLKIYSETLNGMYEIDSFK